MNLIYSTLIWIIIIGGLSFLFRKKIAKTIIKIPAPNWLLYLLVGLLYSILEENINCPISGCALIPPTIVFFFLFLLILLLAVRTFRVKKVLRAFLIFGIIGWIIEFVLGDHKQTLWSLPPLSIAIMSVWTILTYSVIAIIPISILFSAEKKTNTK